MSETEDIVRPVLLGTHEVTLDDLYRVAVGGAKVTISPEADQRVRAARDVVERTLAAGSHAYGLNSGLGHGKDRHLSAVDLTAYAVQTVDAHATAVGPPLPDEEVRALMFARLAGMTRGGAGVHPGAVRVLTEMLNAGITPIVPEVGSVGSSDLMHLAAIAQVAIGRGQACSDGEILTGGEALSRAGVRPHTLAPTDALSLISGNAASIGLGAMAVIDAERIADLVDLAGVLTLEAIEGSAEPFGSEVAVAKPFRGQTAAAAHLRALLDGSDLLGRPHSSTQDPVSLRVMPQVHGAVREAVRAARESVRLELNAKDDNPLISIEHGSMISSGNFHPLVLALAFESLRLAVAHAGMLSERRMNKVVSFSFGTGRLFPAGVGWVPGRYAEEGTLAYSAAALLARLKHRAMPVTLDAPPLDFDIEDHATLASEAVQSTRVALLLLEQILAIEALLAVDKIAALSPRRLGRIVEPAYRAIRSVLDSGGADPVRGQVVDRVRGTLRTLSADSKPHDASFDTVMHE